MKFRYMLITTFVFMLFTLTASAKSPKVGDMIDGGTFLYRQSIEMYWNDWVAFSLSGGKELEQGRKADLKIVGKGKNADFLGNVSIDCKNNKHFWGRGSNFSTSLSSEEKINDVVPQQAIKNALKLFCSSSSPFLQQNVHDYFIFQNDSEQVVPVYNGIISIDRAPFSLRFYNKLFNQKSNKPHHLKLSVLTNKEQWKAITTDVCKEKSPYFAEGSALVFSDAAYTYDAIRFTNNEDGGSHYLPYGDTQVNALDMLKKVGGYYKLEFKIDTFIVGIFKDKDTFKDKRVKVIDSKISEFYLALFNDKNLDNYIDEDELIKFTIKLR